MKISKMPIDAKVFVKKPIPVKAIAITVDFEVETSDGIDEGSKGDYLVQYSNGELQVYPREIFEDTYELLEVGQEEVIERDTRVVENNRRRNRTRKEPQDNSRGQNGGYIPSRFRTSEQKRSQREGR